MWFPQTIPYAGPGPSHKKLHTGVKTLDSQLNTGHITGAIFGVKNRPKQQIYTAANNLLTILILVIDLFKQFLTITLGLAMQIPLVMRRLRGKTARGRWQRMRVCVR